MQANAHLAPQIADLIMGVLTGLLPGLRQSLILGSHCELVLHDFRRSIEHSIVAIDGNLTGREVGGSVSEIGLEIWAQGDSANDVSEYLTHTAAGITLRSTTLLLRDPDGHVFGALCINVDVTEIQRVLRTLTSFVAEPPALPFDVRFSNDLQEVVRAVIDDEIGKIGRPSTAIEKADRLRLFQRLEQRGVFLLQKAVPVIAEALGISRATAYVYLDQIRSPVGDGANGEESLGAAGGPTAGTQSRSRKQTAQ